MLHVLTGADCNNSCIFCMEADRAARRRAVLAQTPADLRAAIRGYPARDHVLFTSGEPTLNDALPDLVGEAAAAGFHTVALITNGRRLAYTAYTELLLRRGLNRVTVSIHGPDAVVHDGLTGVRGSFDQTLRGLRNLAAARPA
ncbi:MAG: radical SAM protein, partial [Deltaproteobacteria bacterium]|nr:radical SAM protein [Deltaproteobacteria bacterium]